jgi:serine phosphatase RsbU (regulator of sigma subunit)
MLKEILKTGIRNKKSTSARIKKIISEKVTLRTDIADKKNKEIIASINYAKLIQEAVLPEKIRINEAFPHSFILYKPKDIVSGDFYWFSEKENKKFIAAVDCTGHGVPGAFVSMLGHSLLYQAVNDKNITDPAMILEDVHKNIRRVLKQYEETSELRDGMDIALCVYDSTTNELIFSGASRPLFMISGDSKKRMLSEFKGEKYGIGGKVLGKERTFTSHKIPVVSGDIVFLFTDGFADQFGGLRGKKLMKKRLKEILLKISHLQMHEQQFALNCYLDEWKGNLEQVDDILIIGLKF